MDNTTKTYRVEIDVPTKLWQRWEFHIKANDQKEAEAKAKQLNEDLENGEQYGEYFSCENLYETEMAEYGSSELQSVSEV